MFLQFRSLTWERLFFLMEIIESSFRFYQYCFCPINPRDNPIFNLGYFPLFASFPYSLLNLYFYFPVYSCNKKNSHFLYLDPPHIFFPIFQILFLLKIMSISVHPWHDGHSTHRNTCGVEEQRLEFKYSEKISYNYT